MHKVLGSAFAALVLTMTSLQAASAATQSAPFTVSASVSTIATVSFGLTNGTYNFGTITDNTNAAVPALNNASAVINADVRTTTGVSTSSIIFTAPTSVTGSASGVIPINAFSYNCSGTVSTNSGVNSGFASTPAAITPVSGVVGTSNPCASIPGGTSIGSTAIVLALTLDDRAIPADNYAGVGSFNVVVTAN